MKTVKKPTKLKLVQKHSKTPPQVKVNRMNEAFIGMLDELHNIMTGQGEPFRARAYQKAAETIMSMHEDITSFKQLKGKSGIGKTIMDKLEEFQTTGTLRVLERERKNPVNLLTKVYGIGPKKAKELVAKGITTLEQLREHEGDLNEVQKIGLKYFDAILKRIPRAEIEIYQKELEKVFSESTPPGSKFEIVGSYRRGAKTSGDIDIIVTNEDNNIGAFNDFLNALIKKKIVIEILSRGKTKSLTIAQLPGMEPRRVDFLYTDPKEFAFALLYFTGSKAFNVVMRQRALDHGYSLNEHGMYHMVSGKKGSKVSVAMPTEQSIFEFLNMQYKEPAERKSGASVEDKKGEIPAPSTEVKIKPTSQMKIKVKKHKTLKLKKTSAKDLIKKFQKEGIDALKIMTEKELSAIIQEANTAYTNQQPIMTDSEYDIVKEYVERKYPKNVAIQEVGAPAARNKVQLPYNMPSMDKIKPDTGAIEAWKEKYHGPYVLSGKLDGVSGLYTTEGPAPKLYTRGNGKVGQDISHMIPFLKLPKTPDISIRGEFIMPKKTFERKYKVKFANPRNLVAGIINKLKKIDPQMIRDLDFVAYEVMKPDLKPSDQMKFLEKENVDTVVWKEKKEINNEVLSELLVDWRKNYVYEIDGVIVVDDQIYPRIEGNPEHAFAFKMVLSDQVAEAKVVNVVWTPSKDGYLVPVVEIEPVVLGGATIKAATAYNASFIEENKIGIGAVVKMIRSGDVIPKIEEVIEPATEPKMPDVPYVWNATHVDVLLKDAADNQTVKLKTITGFFKKLDVEGLGEGNVKRIMEAGYDTIPQILAMTEDDFLEAEGFKKKLASKIFHGIKKQLDAVTLPRLMGASNIWGRGFGERRLKPILEAFPDILTSKDSDEEKEKKVNTVKGMAKKSASVFVEHIPDFIDFIDEANMKGKLKFEQTPVDKSDPMYEKRIVFTGVRDKELEQLLKEKRANVASSVNKDTFVVIVKHLEDDTGKAEQARKLGVPLMTIEQFKTKYNL